MRSRSLEFGKSLAEPGGKCGTGCLADIYWGIGDIVGYKPSPVLYEGVA